MSYFAGNMKKLKMHMLKGMQIHCQRERESATNRDIDKSRSKENYDLVNPAPIDYKAKIEKRIEEAVESGRKIRKDAVVCNTWVITSDKGFFDRIGEKEEKRFFQEAYKWFSERYGAENIAYAMVHRDEKTPHMHLGVIPIKNGRLNSKELFSRAELRAVQAEFPMYIQKRGFDLQRGVPGKQRHMEPVRYKNEQLIQEYMNTVLKLESKAEELTKMNDEVRNIDAIQAKKGGLLNKGKVVISESDWEYLKSQAKRAIGLQYELEKLSTENEFLKTRNELLEPSARRYNQLANFLGKDELDKLAEDTVMKILGRDDQEKGFDHER
jgi:hypothetical protein